MVNQSNLDKFNYIYDKTYQDIFKYVLIKCHDINNVNDIIQDTYLELWRILNKKNLIDINIKSYLIGIAINKIKKHYTLIQKVSTISLLKKDLNDIELINTIDDKICIEDLVVKNDEWDTIWNYIKNKKNKDIAKIFYLHYKLELSIKEISQELDVSESYVKNLIYRTLKELYSLFGEGV